MIRVADWQVVLRCAQLDCLSQNLVAANATFVAFCGGGVFAKQPSMSWGANRFFCPKFGSRVVKLSPPLWSISYCFGLDWRGTFLEARRALILELGGFGLWMGLWWKPLGE